MSIVTFLFVIVVATLIGSAVPWHPLGVLIGVLIVVAIWLQDRSVYACTPSIDSSTDDLDEEDLEETRDMALEAEGREYRDCPVPSCGKTIIVNKDGTLRTHGPKGKRCPGLVVETADPDQLVMSMITASTIKEDLEANKGEYTPSIEEEKGLQEREEEIKNGDYTVYATPEDVIKDLVPAKLLPLNDEEKKELDTLKDYMSVLSLGDRPSSPPAARLQRLIELESRVTLSDDQN